jgi:hypothetical protein
MVDDCRFTTSDTGDYALDAGPITLKVSRLRWAADELQGEVAGHSASGPLPPTRVVFNSAGSRQAVQRLREDDGWSAAIDLLSCKVIDAARTHRVEPVRLRDVAPPSGEREFTPSPMPPLPCDSMAILFSRGGVGKSLLALLAGGLLAQQGIPTLYLDWEWSAENIGCDMSGCSAPTCRPTFTTWPASGHCHSARGM